MEALKTNTQDSYLPVIVLTAQPGHKLRALQAGAKDFVSKPFDLVEVKTRIHNMLEVRLLYKRLAEFNKVLEHTVKFQEITGILYMHLDPGGRIIVSVPNYGHWHTLWVFLARKWPRNERGIFDKTHRTVIMWRNLPEFLRDCPGGELRLVKRNFRFFETKRFWKVNMLITYALFPLLLIPYVNDFVTMGYVFSIRKPASP